MHTGSFLEFAPKSRLLRFAIAIVDARSRVISETRLYNATLRFQDGAPDQTNPTFSGLQKWFWRARSMVCFAPPPNRVIHFAPNLPLPKESLAQELLLRALLKG